jgi:hypothetical protein
MGQVEQNQAGQTEDVTHAQIQQAAQVVQATSAVESGRGIIIKDFPAATVKTLNTANNHVSDSIKRALSTSLKLSKGVFGKVSKVFTVFSGLKRIAEGI